MLRLFVLLAFFAAFTCTEVRAQQCVPGWTDEMALGPNREHHAMGYAGLSGEVVLFGGTLCPEFTADGQTWTWNGATWRLAATDGPSPRSSARMANDTDRGVAVLYGGGTSGNAATDTWEWDGKNWQQFIGINPGPRSGAGFVYDRARGVSVLVCGTPFNSETWTWNGATWTLVSTEGPPPRLNVFASYDEARARVVLFGGFIAAPQGGFIFYGDTWEWDGHVWGQVASTGPVNRHSGSMAYDPQRRTSVLFGGVTINPFMILAGDTWEWDGIAWRQLAISGPAPRARQAMAYDSSRHQIVLFGGGGSNGACFPDTWIFSRSLPADFNQDGLLDSQDFFDYLTAFFTMPTCPQPCPSELGCPADFNHDCLVNTADFFDFLTAFFAGCG